ncbi:MAG: GNAT family acetyltransferase [Xanthobacteraceae bacterium]|nr:GNAT family acetyltransferase [Xanthobacteraceae bacterium]
MVTIATYADRYFGGVDRLWREAFPDDAPRNTAAIAIPQKRQFQPELFLVAIEEDEVIGSLMAGYDGHRGWISRVAVRQVHRRRGIARAMFEEVERRLAKLDCPKINLQVVTSNAAVVPFYERLGYLVEPRISMSKMLPKGDAPTPPGR